MVVTTLTCDTVLGMSGYGSNQNTTSPAGRSWSMAPVALRRVRPTSEQLAALSQLLGALESLRCVVVDARQELPGLLREMGAGRRWPDFL